MTDSMRESLSLKLPAGFNLLADDGQLSAEVSDALEAVEEELVSALSSTDELANSAARDTWPRPAESACVRC